MSVLKQTSDSSTAVEVQTGAAYSRGSRLQRPLPTITLTPTKQEVAPSNGLLEYLKMVSSHKGTLLCFAVAGALIGFLVGLPKTPVYRARTSLEVLELNEDFMNLKQANPISTTDYSYDTSESQTQVKILESDALMKHALASMGASSGSTSSETSHNIPAWRRILHLVPSTPVSKRDRLLNEAAASRTVRVTPRTRILELTIDSTSPKLAAEFANTLANVYIEESQETRWKSSQKTSEWLTKELNETRIKLERSETALQQYAKSSGLISTGVGTDLAGQKLQELQQELTTATADRITKESRYNLAQSAPPDSIADVLNDVPLRQTEARINELRGQLANLETTYNPEYSKAKRVQAELDSLLQVFERDRADILLRIKNDYEEARHKERLLAVSYDVQTGQVVGLSEKSIQYNILKREVDSNRQLYDTMLQQLKQSTVASAMRTSNVRVVDTAEVPTVPFAPNYKVNTMLGLITSLLLGSAFILFRHHGNRTLQGPGELHFWTGLPEFGAIPNVSLAAAKKLGDRSKKLLPGTAIVSPAAGFTANCATLDPAGNPNWTRKPEVVAEAFRKVLASLLFTSDEDKLPNVLVFTSTNPGDGKTTLVGNIGIALAEIGRKVLIIDGDLRRPCMHTLFGVERKGLTDVLREQKPADNAAAGLIQRTRITRLDVLASGEEKGSADLLYSQNLGKILDELSKIYDTILVDTPPMLNLTDARVLGRLSDGVILIARARHTTRDAVLSAMKQLVADRVPVLGCILNDWSPKKISAKYNNYGETHSTVYDQSEGMSSAATA